jgi:hypothetical protein
MDRRLEQFKPEMDRRLEQAKQETDQRFDAVVELVIEVAQRIDASFDGLTAGVEPRFEWFENRLDRMDLRLAGMEINISSFYQALDGHERLLSGLLATQAAQHEAIDNITGSSV